MMRVSASMHLALISLTLLPALATLRSQLMAEHDQKIFDGALERVREVELTESHEISWYGSINGLLTAVFPTSDGYSVEPQWNTSVCHQSLDYVAFAPFVIYVVKKYGRPLLFIDIKPHGHLKSRADRIRAANQIYEKFDDLEERCPIERLYALALMGPVFAIYITDPKTGKRKPQQQPLSERVRDAAPRSQWKYDLRTPTGVTKFTTIVRSIKAMELASRERLRHSDNHEVESDQSEDPNDHEVESDLSDLNEDFNVAGGV